MKTKVVNEDGVEEIVEQPTFVPEVESEMVESQEVIPATEKTLTRRVVRRPLPVVTKRTVYRNVVVNEDSKENELEESQEEPPVKKTDEESFIKSLIPSCLLYTSPSPRDRG